MTITFEWDDHKATLNLKKHQVSFEEARTVFYTALSQTYKDDTHSVNEDRYISIGPSIRGRILVVIHTEQENSDDGITIRIISCRRATPSERKQYEETSHV